MLVVWLCIEALSCCGMIDLSFSHTHSHSHSHSHSLSLSLSHTHTHTHTPEDFPTASNEFLACIKLREGLAAVLASENRFLERTIASTHSDLALCFLMSERAPLVRVLRGVSGSGAGGGGRRDRGDKADDFMVTQVSFESAALIM